MSSKIDKISEKLGQIKKFLPQYLKEQGYDVEHGKKICCLHPDHSDRTPSASIFMHASDIPLLHCFSCGSSADIFTVAHWLEHKPMIGPGFMQDTVPYLAEKYKIEIPHRALSEDEIFEMNYLALYKEVAHFISKQEPTRPVVAEIERRQWSNSHLSSMKIGSCSDYSAMRSHLKSLGFTSDFLDQTDIKPNIFNPNNLIITICDQYGRPVGFTARNLIFDGVLDDGGRYVNGPKYIATNCKGLKVNVFNKADRLFNLHEAKKNHPPLYIFEGHPDVITANLHGLKNAVAIGAVSLTPQHLNLCRRLGIYDLVICLDGDKQGIIKGKELIQECLKTVHDLKLRFVFLPTTVDEEGRVSKIDPDEFIRQNGIKEFLALEKIDPFSWRLREFELEGVDNDTICFELIPIIAVEPSAIKRETMIRQLADATGYSDRAIREELDRIKNEDHIKLQNASESIVGNLIDALEKSPGNALALLQNASDEIYNLHKESSSNCFDLNARISSVLGIKEYQETEEMHHAISFGPFMDTLSVALNGDVRQKMIFLGASPNAGKTSKFANMIWNLPQYNDNTMTIMLTIDDSKREFIPRLLAYDIAKTAKETGNHLLFEFIDINKVSTPFKYRDAFEYDAIMEARSASYAKLLELMKDERVVVFDSEDGKSTDFVNTTLKHFRDKYPERNIYLFVDNFHLLNGSSDLSGREKYKEMSGQLKGMAVKYDCTLICTVEYTKVPPDQKPNNNNIAESVALEYDANMIMHMYSELHSMRDKSTLYFNEFGNQYPIIETNFGKNKIASYKGNVWYKVYPEKAFYEEISHEQAETYRQQNKMALTSYEDNP